MNGIDPRATFWFGVWTNVLLLVASMGIDHAPQVVAQYAPTVQWFCMALYKVNNAVLTALVGLSSTQAGPLIKLPAIPPTIVKILLAAFVLSLFLASSPSFAQTQARRPALQITGDVVKDTKANLSLTGNASADLQALWQKIVGSSINDLTYASAMAASANTAASGVRKQCYDAIIKINEQASGANLKNADGTPMARPDPHLFTDVESLAEIVDNLSPQGPLFTACAGAAQLAKTNTLAFISAVVTGAAGLAALPAGL